MVLVLAQQHLREALQLAQVQVVERALLQLVFFMEVGEIQEEPTRTSPHVWCLVLALGKLVKVVVFVIVQEQIAHVPSL